MPVWTITADRAAEAADVLWSIFPDFPGSEALDRKERDRIAALLHARTIEAGLGSGRIDAWGDPIVGLAVWLRRPGLDEPARPPAAQPDLRQVVPASVADGLERFDATMQRLRAVSRPDRHVYLDMLGVLPAHRRRGIATALLDAGHAWAEGLGLPCALDTDLDENVAFYQRRGYEVVGRERLPDGDHDLVAMRRPLPARTGD
ncbi:MAG TPA: GNAT family N-acetyltransferase [Candidatus Angelobacter sp.]|nr:GNAT family N-acetyltransferase [Candidatus Angelobacter sp.]